MPKQVQVPFTYLATKVPSQSLGKSRGAQVQAPDAQDDSLVFGHCHCPRAVSGSRCLSLSTLGLPGLSVAWPQAPSLGPRLAGQAARHVLCTRQVGWGRKAAVCSEVGDSSFPGRHT